MPQSSLWVLYLGVFIGPFIQEDAAILAAASLSINEIGNWPVLFLTILLGVFFSDAWKYWIGKFALTQKWAQSFIEKKHVTDFRNKVEQHCLLALLAARFLPLTRIPTYVACGLFNISYFKFCTYILVSAFLYISLVFTGFHILGELVGSNLKWVAPIIVFTLIGFLMGCKWVKKLHTNRKKV